MNTVRPLRVAARGADPAVTAWQVLVQACPDPSWVVALPSLQIVAANTAAMLRLGMDETGLRAARADHLLGSPEDMAYWSDAEAGIVEPLLSDTVMQGPDGILLYLRRSIQPFSMPGAAAPTHCLVTLLDTSAARLAQAEQEDLTAVLQATLESTADGILVTDLGGRVRAFNRRFAQVWGMPEDLLVQHHDQAVQDWMRHMVQEPVTYHKRLEALQEATLLAATERLILHSGAVLERVVRPLWSRGRPLGRVWTFRDLSERLATDERIETLVATDNLTGLPNRRRLAERVQRRRWRCEPRATFSRFSCSTSTASAVSTTASGTTSATARCTRWGSDCNASCATGTASPASPATSSRCSCRMPMPPRRSRRRCACCRPWASPGSSTARPSR